MSVLWVKLRDEARLSWHVLRGDRTTRCGLLLPVTVPVVDDLPLDEKSCERCAVLVLHDQERAAE